MAPRDLDTPAVDLREDDGVWWITFNRPEASNAFTLADLDRLSEIIQEAGDRPRAAVLTGIGRRSFSAGMHLEAFRSEEHTSELQSLRHLVCRLLLEKKK